ncbi:MAG: DUF4118 domain-containing protein [Alphaproteobacteria bacterium]|nr:DUF4118 domain-containing protein [Alphaproteobacteria bacterium]
MMAPSTSLRHLWALLSVLAATGVAVLTGPYLNPTDKMLIYLVAVLWSALRFGLRPALLAAVTAILAHNFLFFEPRFAFGLHSASDAVAFGVFATTAFVTSGLVARAHDEAERSRARELELAILYRTGEEIASSTGLGDLVAKAERRLGQVLGAPVRVIADSGGEGFPLCTANGRVGALLVEGDAVSRIDEGLLHALARQIAVAIERERLRHEMEEATVRVRTERTRSALLSSVAHDFRTPLGSVVGASSSLLSREASFTDEARRRLLQTILESAQRLDRYVGNILDLTRIESGAVEPRPDWVDVEDLVGAALDAVDPVLDGHRLVVRLEPDLPPLRVDFVMIERVLVNLLENAARFGRRDGLIEVAAAAGPDTLVLDVFDEGPLVPEDECERLFLAFYRASREYRDGAGLGLSICRAFMAASGGAIEARPRPRRGGMSFVLTFPLAERVPNLEGLDE